MSYVFGPVPSRRLGRTRCKSIKRKEWVPLDDVLDEVKAKLSEQPDYITLSGSGEPTLFSRLGDLVDGIKRMTSIPVALLTNGSLLWKPAVRAAIQDVDLLVPSLDAGDEAMLRRVNRPQEAISFDRLIEGLVASRKACRGQSWLEVFLLAGCTDTQAEVKKLAYCTKLIKPDRIQLNTVTRPPADSTATGVSPERLDELSRLFDPPIQVVTDYDHVYERTQFSGSRKEILSLLRRRPCSVEHIANGLGMHPNEVVKYVDALQAEELLETTWSSGVCYYRLVDYKEQTDNKQASASQKEEIE